MEQLTDSDRYIIGECLRAAAKGPFFRDNEADDPDWEFHFLIGLEREELVQIASAWPNVESRDESVALAVNNSLNNLLCYPHGHDKNGRALFRCLSTTLRRYLKGGVNLKG